MNISDIKTLLNNDKASLIQANELRDALVVILLKIYALAGLTKTFSPEQLKEEMKIVSGTLLNDLQNDVHLKQLRLQEVDYCLMEGMRGEFDDKVKTFGFNYQTFYKWLKYYFFSEERKQALNSFQQDKQSKMIEQVTELTTEEKERLMWEGVNNAYKLFCQQEVQPGTVGQKLTNNGVLDLGGVRDRFLTQKGLKPQGMKIEQFFQECSIKGLKIIEQK